MMMVKEIVRHINAIEPIAQEKFAVLRDHLNDRLSNDSDAMEDYEGDVEVLALSKSRKVLYSSIINHSLFDKEPLDMEYLAMNHNEFPCDVYPDKREYHSYLYHDLIDHSKQYKKYIDSKVGQIYSIEINVKIWELFIQNTPDLPKAIQIAKSNLQAHAKTRSILSSELAQPEVKISAYMFDDDPDAFILDEYEKREGVEDPCNGVIRYYGLHDEGDIPDEIAKRIEFLWIDIRSSMRLSFELNEKKCCHEC